MENEIKTYDVEVVEDEFEECCDTKDNMSTGLAVLIGAGVTAAAVAVVAVGKKVWKWAKARSELHQPEEPIEVTDEDVESVTE